MRNQLKTVLLMTALSGLLLVIGYAAGGRSGAGYAFGLALVMNIGAYWFSDRLVLGMHRAQPLGPEHPSEAYEILQELSRAAGLPMPRLYLIPDHAPNAFATGRDPRHAAVAVTAGLLELLSARELRGVLAHEISHVRNRDILVSTVVAVLASAVMYLAHLAQWAGFAGHSRESNARGAHPLALLVTILLAPLAATLVRAAISRTREFLADERGAQISGDPEALAAALEKISDPALVRVFQGGGRLAGFQPAFGHLYFVNHLSGDSVFRWFSTHPPVGERVRRLLISGPGPAWKGKSG